MGINFDLDFLLENKTSFEMYRILDSGVLLQVPQGSYSNNTVFIEVSRRTVKVVYIEKDGYINTLLHRTVTHRSYLIINWFTNSVCKYATMNTK